jgi:hypothetical protein
MEHTTRDGTNIWRFSFDRKLGIRARDEQPKYFIRPARPTLELEDIIEEETPKIKVLSGGGCHAMANATLRRPSSR